MENLLRIVAVIGPIVVALFASWIAYRQLKVSRDKVRLDLYQRRFAVYETTLSFYQTLLGPIDNIRSESFSELHRNFIRVTRESQFLFKRSSGIFELLERFGGQAFKVIGCKDQGPKLMNDPESFQKMHTEMTEALSYFPKAIERLEHAIEPYLNFQRVLA